MTKVEYKKTMREYRVAFKTKTYDAFWAAVPASKFDLVDSLVKGHHLKDYVWLNRLQVFRIWGV